MLSQPRGGSLHRNSGRGFHAVVLCMPGTLECLFLRRSKSERDRCAKTARILGLDGESAGGNGTKVTLMVTPKYVPINAFRLFSQITFVDHSGFK